MEPAPNTIDAIFSAYDRPNSPGCVLVVIQAGKIIYSRGYGMADLERSVPLSPASIFDIASTGKQFTALVILALAQEGKLALNAPVRQYLPELPAFCDPINIAHLLYHTSGIRDYCGLMELADLSLANYYPEKALFNLITRQRGLVFSPGDEFLYSNSGYFLLGVIARRTASRSLMELIDEWIFKPLGMRHSTFNDDFGRLVPNRALAYTPTEESGFRTDISFCGGFGDGPILTSGEDLFLWDQNFYHNQLCGSEASLIEKMLTPGKLNDGQILEYAAGLEVCDYRGLRLVRHSGDWAGYRSQLLRFPEQRLSVIVLTNLSSISPTRFATQVAELYLPDVLTAVAQPSLKKTKTILTALELNDLVGFYRCPRTGYFLELDEQEGKLRASLEDTSFLLQPVAPLCFRGSDDVPFDLEIEFIQTAPKANHKLIAHIEGERSEVYELLPAPPNLSLEQMAEYTAEYFSEELQVAYLLALKERQLTLQRGYASPAPLRLATADTFVCENLILSFLRDAQGKVVKFNLGAGRIQDIAFARQI